MMFGCCMGGDMTNLLGKAQKMQEQIQPQVDAIMPQVNEIYLKQFRQVDSDNDGFLSVQEVPQTIPSVCVTQRSARILLKLFSDVDRYDEKAYLQFVHCFLSANSLYDRIAKDYIERTNTHKMVLIGQYQKMEHTVNPYTLERCLVINQMQIQPDLFSHAIRQIDLNLTGLCFDEFFTLFGMIMLSMKRKNVQNSLQLQYEDQVVQEVFALL
ncbi:EF-hand_domain pair [Hexamita inflata]|uniref:EF-hand_domain pair n=1 Tax=Hexamita inflata TaxID=28002 RepID=A0ABP1GZW8_9EUKA